MLVSLPSLSTKAGSNMARQIRKKSGTGIYHVMLRGINRQDIFENDEDYLQMTSILRGQSERYDEQGLRLSPSLPIYAISVNLPKSVVLYKLFCNFANKMAKLLRLGKKRNGFLLFYSRLFVTLPAETN